MTEPLTPADCDLRDFKFMPLDVQRLRDSAMAALVNPEAAWLSVLLWCASWHQVPAASLPDDDLQLANFAGFGRVVTEWLHVRDVALRGFVKCSDGRLYHPVVAEKANEAWRAKREQKWLTELARLRKWDQRHGTKTTPPTFEEFEMQHQMSTATNDLRQQMAEARDAAGDALASMATHPGIASIAPLRALLTGDNPCDWTEDVLPAIASAAAWHREQGGAGSMTSWTTATKIAAQNRDKRLAGPRAMRKVNGNGSTTGDARRDNLARAFGATGERPKLHG